MITPRFKLSETDDTLTITIRAPHCDLNALEILAEETVFLFVCSPYYLRLNLPGKIEDPPKSSFDADSGEFHFAYGKSTPGVRYDDLDFVTKFKCVETADKLSCPVLGEKCEELSDVQYGFALRGDYRFCYSDEFAHVLEMNPLKVRLEERRRMRLEDEKSRFSEEHYLADLIEDDDVQEILRLETPWTNLSKDDVKFTDEELDFLKDLKNVQYDLNEEQIRFSHNGLLDLLYAYCYDRRTTYFEGTCESGWTISKLSSTLCWFEGFASPQEAVVSAYRRSLIFPLYRNFELCQQILKDVKTILELGEKFIVKCLIEIYGIFLGSERYILNNLFINDYITYVQKWDKDLWKEYVTSLDKTTVTKKDLGLNLCELQNSLDNESNLCLSLAQLNVDESEEETDSDDSSDCTD